MSSERPGEKYEKYLNDPNSVKLPEVQDILAWRDKNPVESAAIRARMQAEMREAQDAEVLFESWIAEGGDPDKFDAHYKKLRSDNAEARIRNLDEAAHIASFREMKGNF